MKTLVIGSVHLDIIGNYDLSVKSHIDKEGSLKYSVGGAAYNIAANLSYKKQNVSLFTYLKKDSLSTEVIKSSLIDTGMDTKYILEDSDLNESGYISHSISGNLTSAVSSMAIQEKAFDEQVKESLDTAIRSYDLIVVETNLTVEQIEVILDFSDKYGKPVFICSVSDSKCKRILNIRQSQKSDSFRFVSLNENELSTIFGTEDQLDSNTICNKFKSETVLVTHGKKGYTVFSRNKSEEFCGEPVPVTTIKSELGAGDALFAAVVNHYLINRKFNWQNCKHTINEYVGRVLKSEGATPEGLNIKFQKVQSKEKIQSLLALSSSLLAAIFTAIGFFISINVNLYAILFLTIPFLSGISGAFIRHLLGKGNNISKDIITNISLGGVAGLLVSFTFFLSHWSTLGNSISTMISKSEVVPENMRPILGFLLLSAFVAGLAVEVAFEKTAKKNYNETFKEQ